MLDSALKMLQFWMYIQTEGQVPPQEGGQSRLEVEVALGLAGTEFIFFLSSWHSAALQI